MKVMKKLLIEAVCVLTFAVSVYAANEDGNNDQNDNSLNHILVNIVNMDNDERDLVSQLHSAIHSWNGATRYECDGILNDKITYLINQGADITNKYVGNLQLLYRVVFCNSRYNELPDYVKNCILGKSLLYYVEKRTRGTDLFVDSSFHQNYNIIDCLLKFRAPTNFLDNEGRTVLDIVENRNNLWENGTYNLADDPEFSFFYETPNTHGGLILDIRDYLESSVKPNMKNHDQEVYKLLNEYVSCNRDNNG